MSFQKINNISFIFKADTESNGQINYDQFVDMMTEMKPGLNILNHQQFCFNNVYLNFFCLLGGGKKKKVNILILYDFLD